MAISLTAGGLVDVAAAAALVCAPVRRDIGTPALNPGPRRTGDFSHLRRVYD